MCIRVCSYYSANALLGFVYISSYFFRQIGSVSLILFNSLTTEK